MRQAVKAYATVAKETASPRELEASLLLKAASKLQFAYDGWNDGAPSLGDALLYNRRLWTIFMESVSSNDNALPVETRQNIANLGIFIMNETLSILNDPQPASLLPLININRGIATGLRGRN
jgi:flagellar protein FlaF